MDEDMENYAQFTQDLKYDAAFNNIFKSMSGYYYDHTQKELVKIEGFKKIMETNCVHAYMDRTIKAVTDITILGNNTDKLIAYKSMSFMEDILSLTQSLSCVEKNKMLRKMANDRLGELKSIIKGLTNVVHDSYTRSRKGKTADLLYKQHHVNESITSTKGKQKTGFMDRLNPSKPEEEEE